MNIVDSSAISIEVTSVKNNAFKILFRLTRHSCKVIFSFDFQNSILLGG